MVKSIGGVSHYWEQAADREILGQFVLEGRRVQVSRVYYNTMVALDIEDRKKYRIRGLCGDEDLAHGDYLDQAIYIALNLEINP